KLPAPSVVEPSPPATAKGGWLHRPTLQLSTLPVSAPTPRAPSKLSPQRYAAPFAVTAQVGPQPALNDENVSPPATARGAEPHGVEPVQISGPGAPPPKPPYRSPPQQ